ncbi:MULTISPECIES: hypothetical protein [Phyllobacteriaceae]|jgi:uncharacterized membrane-anchored protein|nr:MULTISPECIES: hypothetical protein [Mesorhizobium]MBN9235576.1 hypothetical protein [Mesorhizobium sp.]MDQ0331269.1 putative membrane-anchored protein [Mesorhizobium sp. YL-MeA3-2017]
MPTISLTLAFLIAYVLIRLVGASIGDFLAKPVIAGGPGQVMSPSLPSAVAYERSGEQ